MPVPDFPIDAPKPAMTLQPSPFAAQHNQFARAGIANNSAAQVLGSSPDISGFLAMFGAGDVINASGKPTPDQAGTSDSDQTTEIPVTAASGVPMPFPNLRMQEGEVAEEIFSDYIRMVRSMDDAIWAQEQWLANDYEVETALANLARYRAIRAEALAQIPEGTTISERERVLENGDIEMTEMRVGPNGTIITNINTMTVFNDIAPAAHAAGGGDGWGFFGGVGHLLGGGSNLGTKFAIGLGVGVVLTGIGFGIWAAIDVDDMKDKLDPNRSSTTPGEPQAAPDPLAAAPAASPEYSAMPLFTAPRAAPFLIADAGTVEIPAIHELLQQWTSMVASDTHAELIGVHLL